MQIKETKIATYTDEKTRIQLLKITTSKIENTKLNQYGMPVAGNKIIYQIRVNRKRIYTTGFENDARLYFSNIIRNDILQLKIY